MDKKYDFSRLNRAIEIKALEMYVKQRANEAITKSTELYGPEHGPIMAATMVDPCLINAWGHLQQLKMEQQIATHEYVKQQTEIDRKFMKKMFGSSQEEES